MSAFEFIAEAAKGKLVSAVASVMQWPVLAKATSNDDEATPGYVFDEIASKNCKLAERQGALSLH
jgi:hypothetical protein